MKSVEVLVPATVGGTSQVKKPIGSYPACPRCVGDRGVVFQAGALLVETVRKAGLDQVITAALMPWRYPRVVHGPRKILLDLDLDLALAVALGGDCLADARMLRAESTVLGPVASGPKVSRLIDTLAPAGPKALSAMKKGRAGRSA